MVVNRGLFDAACLQRAHDRRDLVLEEDQVAHDHRLAVRITLECRPSSQSKGRLDGDIIQLHRQVGAGKSEPLDTAGVGSSFPAEYLLDACPACGSWCW